MDIRKVVCCPKRARSRISYSLILRSDPKENFENHSEELGGPEFLPD